MPVEITAYECMHGCGKFLKTSRAMVKHENRCLNDLAGRTCKTCEYDYRSERGFDCGAGIDKRGKKIIRHCRMWVEKGMPEQD